MRGAFEVAIGLIWGTLVIAAFAVTAWLCGPFAATVVRTLAPPPWIQQELLMGVQVVTTVCVLVLLPLAWKAVTSVRSAGWEGFRSSGRFLGGVALLEIWVLLTATAVAELARVLNHSPFEPDTRRVIAACAGCAIFGVGAGAGDQYLKWELRRWDAANADTEPARPLGTP